MLKYINPTVKSILFVNSVFLYSIQSKEIDVPGNVNLTQDSGSCGSNEQDLVVKWENKSFTMEFAKKKKDFLLANVIVVLPIPMSNGK